MVTELRRRSWTAEEYHRMVAVGLLDVDEQVELLEGEIVEMSPTAPRHSRATRVLNFKFSQHARSRYLVNVQDPLQTSATSEPEPDVSLLVWRDDFYATTPTAQDSLLAIEVAESSVDKDRHVKIPMYGRAGVPEAWLVDLVTDTVEVHRGPSPTGYTQVTVHQAGVVISPAAFPDVVIDVAEVLGH